jgi:predicted Zn-dependent protease
LVSTQSYAFFGEFSIQDEAKLGEKFHVLIQTFYPVIQDPEILDYIDEVVDQLNAVIPPHPFSFHVGVLKDNSLNAFAAPAGYIYVHSGLILQMKSSSELAAILAHEMAHVTQRHIAQNVERSKLISIGTLAGVLAGALIGQSSAVGEALAVGSIAGGQATALKFSRDDEREADQVGLRYLLDTDFDAQGMLEAFQTIKRHSLLGGSGSPPPYMMTHPGLAERLGYVKDLIERLSEAKVLVSKDDSRLQRVQTLLRARYTDAHTAKIYYQQKKNPGCLDLLGQGIVLERMNDMDQARDVFQRARDCSENDPLFFREIGRFFYQLGHFDKAEASLKKALDLNQKDYFARYFWAKTLAETGQMYRASQEMRQVVRLLPEDADVHYSLGRILGQSGNKFLGYLHYAYAYLYSGKKKRAEYYLTQAKDHARTPSEQEKLKTLQEKYEERKEYW